jgi:hypothetical protein
MPFVAGPSSQAGAPRGAADAATLTGEPVGPADPRITVLDMPQITEAERIRRISQLLSDLNKVPPERHEVERLPWTGGEHLLCPVIKISVDEVVLNHRSHRIRAQLEDDREWQELRKDPQSEAAQRLIERHVRRARKEDEFLALKESLVNEGQSHPGVMTHSGLLVNANTRVVALRDTEDPARRYVRVAVLPQVAQPDEFALLELRLQMQKELKVEYSMTNELLFIEELSKERRLSPAQIARELRIFPESQRKGENEVVLRLRMFDLIRTMQTIPAERLPLTFFDRISYEQLRELHRTYFGLIERDPQRAQRHLQSFLLSVAVGVTPVHQIRRIDADFMSEYMLPELDEDEAVGKFATALVTPDTTQPPDPAPAGVDHLVPAPDDPEPPEVGVKALLDVVTRRDKRVEVPGSNFVLERNDLTDAVKAAVLNGIKDKRRDETAEDKLAAPIDAVKQATKMVSRAEEAWRVVRDDPEFDDKRRKSLEVAHKKLRRSMRDLEAALTKDHVLAGK